MGFVASEIAEEAHDELFLFLVEIFDAVQFVEIAHVVEQLLCIGHILVDVVKVGQKQLPPSEEVVECLVNACDGGIALMQQADRLDGVGYRELGTAPKQLTDGDVGWSPNGFLGHARQFLVEKESRTLVGENNRQPTKVRPVAFVYVLSNVS